MAVPPVGEHYESFAGDDEPQEYGLVMPFVVTEDQGGPYKEKAYVAGWRVGSLDTRLELQSPPTWEGYVNPPDVPQIDLVAMRHGYTMVTEAYDDEWTHVTLTLAKPE